MRIGHGTARGALAAAFAASVGACFAEPAASEGRLPEDTIQAPVPKPPGPTAAQIAAGPEPADKYRWLWTDAYSCVYQCSGPSLRIATGISATDTDGVCHRYCFFSQQTSCVGAPDAPNGILTGINGFQDDGTLCWDACNAASTTYSGDATRVTIDDGPCDLGRTFTDCSRYEAVNRDTLVVQPAPAAAIAGQTFTTNGHWCTAPSPY